MTLLLVMMFIVKKLPNLHYLTLQKNNKNYILNYESSQKGITDNEFSII